LTVADTTALVQECTKRHNLAKGSAYLLGKALSAMTYMSACLKMEKGEISLSLKTDGECRGIGISGNQKLYLRGYIENPSLFGEDMQAVEKNALQGGGSFTVIRDDGYNRPFVGSCGLDDGTIDGAFERYYATSEQLPTRIYTTVEFNEKDEISFAGVVALQPLPFAEEHALKKTAELPMESLLISTRDKGVEEGVLSFFEERENVWSMRKAIYKCNCSREYLSAVLTSLGEREMRKIIREEGKVEVHCHYCNTDYEFTGEDEEELFPRR
jgi:molecular chaperone Hsp33